MTESPEKKPKLGLVIGLMILAFLCIAVTGTIAALDMRGDPPPPPVGSATLR